MVTVAVWSAPDGGKPRRLIATPPNTEAALEAWVKTDPALVRDGLVVIAQQLVFSGRDRLDLLCIEGRSRWVVVELKRDRMPREVAAQALDYVSQLATMARAELATRLESHLASASEDTRELVSSLLEGESEDNPRDVSAVVVGVSADEPLLRITTYLSAQYNVPISVVELQSFLSPSGDLLIVREETGTDVGPITTSEQPSASVEERWRRVRSNADEQGFSESLAAFTSLVEGAGLYVRPYTRSVMVTPPTNRTRYIAVVSFTGGGPGKPSDLSYGLDAFLEFFPDLDREVVSTMLGPTSQVATPEQLVLFGQRIADLMATRVKLAPSGI